MLHDTTSVSSMSLATQLETVLFNSRVFEKLQQDTNTKLFRPHLDIDEDARNQNFITGTLTGTGGLELPPFTWVSLDRDSSTNQVTTIVFVGSKVSGHPGIVHGGFLASVLDEIMARCAFPLLPSGVGATARLEIDYKHPATCNQFVLLTAHSSTVEGRKVWVKASVYGMGHLEKEDDDAKVLLVNARGLFVEPKNQIVRTA